MNDVASDKSAKFRAQCDELVRSDRASEASIAHLRQLGKMLVDATEGGLKRVSVEDCKRRRDECWSPETGSEKTVEEGRHWQECELYMRIGKMLLEVAGNLVYIHPDTQEVYEAMVADFAAGEGAGGRIGDRGKGDKGTGDGSRDLLARAVYRRLWGGQAESADNDCGFARHLPGVQASGARRQDLGRMAERRRRGAEQPQAAFARIPFPHRSLRRGVLEVGRSIPPRWLLDWVGDVAFLQELMNLWDGAPPNDVVFDHGWGKRNVVASSPFWPTWWALQNHWPRVWLSRWRPNASPARNAHGKDRGLQVPGVRWGGGRADSTVFADSRLGADGGVLPAA